MKGETEMIGKITEEFSQLEKGKFEEIWNLTKIVMDEKLNCQKSLLEILIRCVGFLVKCCEQQGDEEKPNEMDKFMLVEMNNNILNSLTSKKVLNFRQNERIINLNDFIKNIKKINENLHNEKETQLISEILKDFSFSHTVYNKCEDLLNLFFNNQCNYFLNIKKLIWAMYIYHRKRFLNNSRNLLESLPVLISLISLILKEIDIKRFSFELINSIEKQIKKNDSNYNTLLKNKKYEIILQRLIIKTGDHIEIPKIEKIQKEFLFEDQKLEQFLIRENEEIVFIFNFEDENLIINLIDVLLGTYEKQLRFKNFDERIFLLNNNNSDCSPVKLTPFKRQKIMSNESFLEKRPINNTFRKIVFEEGESSVNSMNNINNNMSPNNINNNNLFKGIDIKELSKKINEKLHLTPCSRVIVMDKWTKDYIKTWSNEKFEKYEFCYQNSNTNSNHNFLKFVNENLQKIQKLLETYHVKLVTSLEEIEKLILKLIYGLMNREERMFRKEFVSRLLNNQNFLKSVIVVGVEIILFIENVEYICFYKLANALDLDLFEFWKIINPFTKFDLTVPSVIRQHFQAIEIQLWSFMIWKRPSDNFKEEINEFLNKYKIYKIDKEIKMIEDMEFNNQSLFIYQDKSIQSEKDFLEIITPENLSTNSSSTSMNSSKNLKAYKHLRPIYIFLRRILNYSIFLNKKIAENLKLSTESAKECENLFKSIMTEIDYFDVLYNKHIDQVIICCIIAVMKTHKIYEQKDIKIILDAYQKSKMEDSDLNLKSLFHNIKTTKHQNIDIIEFYNSFFIKKVGKLVEFICGEEERIDSRKRKLSLPDDTEMKKLQFESETAFEKDTIMYEPLKNTIFNENSKLTPQMIMSNTAGNLSYSVRCSPILSKSMYASPNVNGTPRSKALKDLYSDYISSDVLIMSNQSQQSSGGNIFKKKIKSQMSQSKIILNRLDNQSPISPRISDFSTNLNFLQFNETPSPSINLSQQQSDSFFNNPTINNSQTTPEFNKIQKEN